MSGGSMDYLYSRVEDASFRLDTTERRAFHRHLQAVAEALRAIEWNDSGDGDPDESAKIQACLSTTVYADTVIEEARDIVQQLRMLLIPQRGEG